MLSSNRWIVHVKSYGIRLLLQQSTPPKFSSHRLLTQLSSKCKINKFSVPFGMSFYLLMILNHTFFIVTSSVFSQKIDSILLHASRLCLLHYGAFPPLLKRWMIQLHQFLLLAFQSLWKPTTSHDRSTFIRCIATDTVPSHSSSRPNPSLLP